jgi:hypothetical protein
LLLDTIVELRAGHASTNKAAAYRAVSSLIPATAEEQPSDRSDTAPRGYKTAHRGFRERQPLQDSKTTSVHLEFTRTAQSRAVST